MFFVVKMREAFAKILAYFRYYYRHILDITIGNFNETLTNDIVSFEQPGPSVCSRMWY